MPAAVRTRRTQKERRDETRRAVLDATVACLIELGYKLVDHRLELYAVPLDDKPRR